ncbi:MAG: hypothetical protein HY721_30225, partial [Planctomycetes bacterium]|nr:hypothetical protein [Planctomycetota bacterium]
GGDGGGSAAKVEIPKSLTLEIAREVAGRVKESVLSSLRQAPERAAGEEDRSPPPAAPKKIPLDDLSAIIDQLTGRD